MNNFLSLGRKLEVRSKRALHNLIVLLFDSFFLNLGVFFHVLNNEQVLNFDAIVFDFNVDFLIFQVIINA